MKLIKIIVEKHADGYVAYPLGLKGVVVGEGDTYNEREREAVKQAVLDYVEGVYNVDPSRIDQPQ